MCHGALCTLPPACSDMSGVLPRIIITAEEAQDELRDLCYIIKVRAGLCSLKGCNVA